MHVESTALHFYGLNSILSFQNFNHDYNRRNLGKKETYKTFFKGKIFNNS